MLELGSIILQKPLIYNFPSFPKSGLLKILPDPHMPLVWMEIHTGYITNEIATNQHYLVKLSFFLVSIFHPPTQF